MTRTVHRYAVQEFCWGKKSERLLLDSNSLLYEQSSFPPEGVK